MWIVAEIGSGLSGAVPVLGMWGLRDATGASANLAPVLLAVALLEMLLILLLYRKVRQLNRRLQGESPSTAGPHAAKQAELSAIYAKALTGSLERFSVAEVVQFLNAIRESGVLDVVDDAVQTVHRLLLHDGEIVDAYDGEKRGDPAVNKLLQTNQGTFTFLRGDLQPEKRTVQTPTMTLLMEAAKQLDEDQAEESGVLSAGE